MKLTQERGSSAQRSSVKYRTIADGLRARIIRGEWAVGERLPSIRQISRELNVSEVTAFRGVRLLNDEGYVSSRPGREGTYVISTNGAPAATPTTLGVLLRRLGARDDVDNFALDIVDGFQQRASSHHCRLILHTLTETDVAARLLELANSRAVAGFVLDQKTPLDIIRRITETGLPSVLMNRVETLPGLSAVAIDYRWTGQETARRLLGCGYQRLAVYRRIPPRDAMDEATYAEYSVVHELQAGFFAEAARAGLASEDCFAIPAARETGLPIADPKAYGLPRRKPADWRPLGILANHDRLANALIDAVGRTDLALGRDIGVVGFGDLECDARVSQPPSTWRVARADIGARTADELMGRIADPARPAGVAWVLPEYVDRSTA